MGTFVRVEGVRLTNDAGERAVRLGVLGRKGSFGTQSVAGSRFVERLMTVVATRKPQRRNVLGSLTAACEATLRGGEGSLSAACLLTIAKPPLDRFPEMEYNHDDALGRGSPLVGSNAMVVRGWKVDLVDPLNGYLPFPRGEIGSRKSGGRSDGP